MVDVSQAWIDAHKQTLLPETFVEITYSVTEPGLQEDATPSANTETTFSDVGQVTDGLNKQSEEYAALEQGVWGLDGSVNYFDGTPNDPGYVSEVLSGADGSFSSVPTITVAFATQRQVAIPGLTITWSSAYNEWASEFRVRAYSDSSLVAEKTVIGNTAVISEVAVELNYYNRITIEILKWSHPYHRARCLNITLGLSKMYTKDDLISFTHSQSADLLSAALPTNEIKFSLRNETAQWNPDNPTGIEQYLTAQQEVRVRYGMQIGDAVEWIPGGTFWLSEWSTPSNGITADFVAKCAFDVMSEQYEGVTSGTLFEIAQSAFEQADLNNLDDGSPRFVLSESLMDYSTTFEDSSGYTLAEIVQMVAHAGNCVLYQDRYGVVHIEPWNTQYRGYIVDRFVAYSYPEYEISKPLKAVSVSYGGEERFVVTTGAKGEIQTVDNPMITTVEDAEAVANRAAEILVNRKVISGDYRADVRLDALDAMIVTSKYSSNVIGVTNVEYSTTGGGLKGRYTGRVISINLEPTLICSGEVYAGEV